MILELLKAYLEHQSDVDKIVEFLLEEHPDVDVDVLQRMAESLSGLLNQIAQEGIS